MTIKCLAVPGEFSDFKFNILKWQKYSAGLIRKTEASLAEKAGHLEMLSGGKKGKKGEGGEKKKKDGGKKMKK